MSQAAEELRIYVSYEEVHLLVSELSRKIGADAWTPDCIVAIASGGFIPARILKTYLKKPIYVVGLKRYLEDGEVIPVPEKMQWIDDVERKLSGKKVLLVDEVDDTRITLSYCLSELLRHRPAEIRVAVLHNKKKPKLADYPPATGKVYWGVEIEDAWIKYPWDATDIIAHNQMVGD